MFDNLENTRVMETTEDELLLAAGLSDDSTKKPNDDKKPSEDKNKSDKSKDKSAPESVKATASVLSKSDLEQAFGDSDDDAEPKDDNEKDVEDEDVDNDKDKDEDEDKDKDDNKGDETPVEIKDFLKARVEFLIQNGKWVDFEGREEVEWSEETFAEIELKQDEVKRNAIKEELLTSFGPYGKQIAEHSANGGDPDKLIDIFKEQMEVQSLSIDTEDQQKDVVFKYETEYLGKKPERVKKYIDSLIADKELSEEASLAKEAMDKIMSDQAKELQDAQKEQFERAKTKQKEQLEKFSSDVSTYLTANSDIPATEKKQILDVLTKFDKKLKNGSPVNEFYFKFAEIKKNLPDYIELVRFVLNPSGYKKAEKIKGKNEATEKSFKLIRTGQNTRLAKSSDKNSSASGKGTGFKLI